MSQQFRLPDLGEGLTEAEVVAWLVAPGNTVAVDQPIVEVESAKSVVELPSPFSGVVEALHVAVGQTVRAGEPLLSVARAYANVQAFTGSIIGKLIVFGYTWALIHHLLSGLRHFVWDLGYGFKANEREALTWGALIGGISLTVLVWIIAYTVGGGR